MKRRNRVEISYPYIQLNRKDDEKKKNLDIYTPVVEYKRGNNPATEFQLEGGNLVKATGMMVYNTSNELKGPGVYLWNGVNWGLLTPQWQFSVSAQTSGSVSGSSSGTYDDNATINVTASANTGYTFSGWYENGTQLSTAETYSFTITDNRTIEARFTINTYTFSRSAGTGGTVSGTANGN